MLSNCLVFMARSIGLTISFVATFHDCSASEIEWKESYKEAKVASNRLGQPIVIVVGSKGCGWCRKLEQTTLRDRRVLRALNETVIPFKLSVDDPANTALIEALGVEGLPAIYVVSPQGRLVANQTGYLDSPQFLRMLKDSGDQLKRSE